MRIVIRAVVVCLISASAANAQAINQQVRKGGGQVFTEIVQVKPPPAVEGKPAVGTPSATAVVMITKDWRCARLFTDDHGCRWKLVSVAPMDFQPNALSGWHMVSVEGQHTFVTITGRVFTRISCPPEVLAPPQK